MTSGSEKLKAVLIGLGIIFLFAGGAIGTYLLLNPEPKELPPSANKDLRASTKATSYIDRLDQISLAMAESTKADRPNALTQQGIRILEIRDATKRDLTSLPPVPASQSPEASQSRNKARDALSLISQAAESLARSNGALDLGVASTAKFAKASPSDENYSGVLDASEVAERGINQIRNCSELMVEATRELRRVRTALQLLTQVEEIDDPEVRGEINGIGEISGSTTKGVQEVQEILESQRSGLEARAGELEPIPEPSAGLVQCGSLPFDQATDPISDSGADPCAVHEIVRSTYYQDPGICFEGCPINVASVDTFQCQPPGEPVTGSQVEGGYLVRCTASDPNFYVEFYWGS